MKTVEKIINVLLILSIVSIYVSRYKVYPIFFALTIMAIIVYILLYDKFRVTLTQKYLFLFTTWALFTTAFHSMMGFYNPNSSLVIKFVLNLSFLFLVSVYVNQLEDKNIKRYIIYTIETVIILNFIQLVYIYLGHNLISGFLHGDFRSSNNAYVITQFNNFFGGENKNIWASKVALTQVAYYFVITYLYKEYKSSTLKSISLFFINVLSILMLLSRTSQVAMIIPYGFLIFEFVRKREFYKKHKKLIFGVVGIGFIGALIVFFRKFFHIRMDMNDGGLTRIYIWIKAFTNMFGDMSIILGRGIDYSQHFLTHVVQRTESNVHNVILNITLEQGIIGATLYVGFLLNLFRDVFNKKNWMAFICVLIIPFCFIISLQYLGYDNDLVLFFLMLYIFKPTANRLGEKNYG